MYKHSGKLLSIVLIIAMSLSISACSNSKSTVKTNSKTVLNVMTWDASDPTVKKIFANAISAYSTSHPNVELKLKNVAYADYFTKLQTQLAAGSPPDVYELGESDWNKYWNKGLLLDLTSFTTGKNPMNMGDFYPSIMNAVMQNGKLPVIPFGPATLVVSYNKKIFDAAKIPYPTSNWSWDDFEKVALKLTKVQNGKTVQWGALLPCSSDDIEPLIISSGSSILSPNGKTATGYLNSTNTVNVIKWYANMVLSVSPTPVQQKAFGTGANLFDTGKVAMSVDGPWAIPNYQMDTKLSYGTVELPKLNQSKGNDLMYCGGYGISSKSKNSNDAWDFIKEFLDPSTAAGKMQALVSPPATKTLAKAPSYTNVVWKPFLNELDTGIIKSAYFLNPYFRSAQSQFLDPTLQTVCSEKGVNIKSKMDEVAKQMDLYFAQQTQ